MRKRCGGFTLVETLAALAITAVIFVAASGLVRDVAMSFDRGTRTLSTVDRLALAVERLAGDFGAARFVQMTTDTGTSVAFISLSGRLTFVSGAGIAAGPRGEELVTLSIEPAGDLTRLIRRRTPWRGPSARISDATPQDPVILIEGNYDMAFAFGRVDAEGRLTWVQNWSDQNAIPQSVRLVLRDRTSGMEILPRAEFRLRSDMMISCAHGGPTCEANGPKSGGKPGDKPGAKSAAKPEAKTEEPPD